MKYDIRCQGVENHDEVRAQVERRLSYALGRFSARLDKVGVFLSDQNGPKGGDDKRCRLVTRLPRLGIVTVEDTDSDLTVLIDRTANRMARTVQRTLERSRNTGYRPDHGKAEFAGRG